MKVTYNGPYDAVELADTGQIIERGESAEVADELALRLVEQTSFDTDPKTLLAAVGKNTDLAARMLRAELDGELRASVVRPLEKLLKTDVPADLDEAATNDPPAGQSAEAAQKEEG